MCVVLVCVWGRGATQSGAPPPQRRGEVGGVVGGERELTLECKVKKNNLKRKHYLGPVTVPLTSHTSSCSLTLRLPSDPFLQLLLSSVYLFMSRRKVTGRESLYQEWGIAITMRS